MKNLYQQNKSRRRLLVATVFVIAVFVADTLSGGSARAFARAGAAYMWATGASAGETVFDSGFFSTRRALEKENKSLREELTQLQTRVAVFDILKSENESLRLLTGFTERGCGIFSFDGRKGHRCCRRSGSGQRRRLRARVRYGTFFAYVSVCLHHRGVTVCGVLVSLFAVRSLLPGLSPPYSHLHG